MEIEGLEMKERIKKVEDNITLIQYDISTIKTDNAVIKNELRNISSVLENLPCKEHFAEDRKLEEKIAETRASALLEDARIKAEALLKVDEVEKKHGDRFVCIEKKLSNWTMIWATVLGGVALLGMVLAIASQITGMMK